MMSRKTLSEPQLDSASYVLLVHVIKTWLWTSLYYTGNIMDTILNIEFVSYPKTSFVGFLTNLRTHHEENLRGRCYRDNIYYTILYTVNIIDHLQILDFAFIINTFDTNQIIFISAVQNSCTHRIGPKCSTFTKRNFHRFHNFLCNSFL